MPDVHVTRDTDGAWRIEGDDRVIISNLTTSPPGPVADAIEREHGRRPTGYARVRGPRGLLRLRAQFRAD